jgi:1,5-anhydro-D-fructose reductase (1,5-anhydro-D-mannitol-forming)
VVFATNHHLRNAGSHLAIQELISSGAIGDVLSVRVFHAVNLPESLRGWRINDKDAGGGVIADIIVHDADTVRFHLSEDPVDVVAMAAATGLGEGVEDSVMTIWRMPSGAMVQAHASFTHKFTETGIEIYGTEGTIRGPGIMTQRPAGTVELINSEGSHAVPFSDHGLYMRAVRKFEKSVSEGAKPAADGIDGIKSLAVALSVLEAAASGNTVSVDYAGY